MADWLAYGLEDAFSDRPEIAILRKNRTASGLVRYDAKHDTEWAQAVKEIISEDKPKALVMMIGVNDRQPIRERPGAAGKAVKPAASPLVGPLPNDPELQARESAEQQNAELQGRDDESEADQEPRGSNNSHGPFEFHTERWEAAYVRRIDATIAAMKSAGVPVFWVGLPSQRNSRASSDSAYLNELYRQRAERAGIVFIDIWDGFVDDAGRFASQGPDFEGQIRRLRSGDGVYFTKAGARKLAHFVEREIQRIIVKPVQVALPAPEPVPVGPGSPRSGGPAARPLAGPVIPLTVSTGSTNELLGADPATSPAADATAARVLTNGDPINGPSGRADDFSWPRGSNPLTMLDAVPPDPVPAKPAAAGQRKSGPSKPPAEAQGKPAKRAPKEHERPRRRGNTAAVVPRPPQTVSR
jgi:lysophospholipase L1-like esterase